MGCFFSKNATSITKEDNKAPEEPKKYSWDKREKVDPRDFTIENVKGETVGRVPKTVNGQQFIIQNCEDANIYLYDHTASITVDDCKNCRIFLGPIKGSIFIRDCESCRFMVACQQFRTRDCKKMDIFLCCTTQPIIESTTGLKVACYRYNYPELGEQFRQAGLSVFNCNWSNLHDFTPVPGENNFELLPEDVKVDDYIPLPTTEQFQNMQIELDPVKSLVPQTCGSRRRASEQSCLVVFFHDSNSSSRAMSFIKEMTEKHVGCKLMQTREVPMQTADAEKVFGTDSYSAAVSQGSVIGLEYNGPECVEACRSIRDSLQQTTAAPVFVTSDPTTASHQIENFYTFADSMQMGI